MQKKFGANWFLVYSRQKEGKVKTTRRSERESGMLKKTVESQQHFISLCTHLKRGKGRIFLQGGNKKTVFWIFPVQIMKECKTQK